MAFSSTKSGHLFVIVTLLGALAGGLFAGPRSSLSDLDLETAEAKLTLEQVLRENAHLKDEAQQLQEKLAVHEAAATRLTQSLALANSESEIFRRQVGELRLRLEALGIEGGSGGANKLEQRLLAATSDFRLAEKERVRLRESLQSLSDAAQQLLARNTPEARDSLARQAKQARDSLSATAVKTAVPPPPSPRGR